MPIKTDIWTVDAAPTKLIPSRLVSEQFLEDMIVNAPGILSDEWMLIGRQESTGMGGRIDLLAIAPDGALVLIELKRDRTPREVVAQALDYAVWVEGLRNDEIGAIYKRFRPGRNLDEDFRHRFGRVLVDEELNKSHQLIIVATELDASSERIVVMSVALRLAGKVGIDLATQLGIDKGFDLCAIGLKDAIQAEVRLRLVSWKSSPSRAMNGSFACSYVLLKKCQA